MTNHNNGVGVRRFCGWLTRLGLLAVIAGAFAATGALGQQQVAKLIDVDGKQNDNLGRSVAISGGTVVVGSYMGTPVGDSFSRGVALIYRQSEGAWQRVARINSDVTDDATIVSEFGAAVAIDGNTIVVGARREGVAGPLATAGAAYIFREVDGEWERIARLFPDDPFQEFNDNFGYAVSISGDTVVVSEPGDNEFGTNSGALFVFREIDGDWQQIAKLTTDDAEQFNQLGLENTVKIIGDTILVGAPTTSPAGGNSGSAYFFREIEGVWQQTAKLTPDDGAAFDFFGISASFSGDTALIGSFRDDDDGSASGSAYVFREIDGDWQQIAKVTASDAAAGDNFGASVSIDGDTAIIGASGNDQAGDNSGSAYFFLEIDGVWQEIAKVTADDAVGGELLGSTAAFEAGLASGTAVIGAIFDDPVGSQSGSAYIFTLPAAGIATIQGTVQSLGHCGVDVQPLPGATVEIAGQSSTFFPEIGADGAYESFLPESESPATITVTAPGHQPASVTDVAFSAGDVVTQNFDLTLDAPCLTTNPAALVGSLEPGQSVTETLTIDNGDGAAELTWQVTEEVSAAGLLLRSAGSDAITPQTHQAPAVAHGLAPASGVQDGVTASHPFPRPAGDATAITQSQSMNVAAMNTIACTPDGGTTTAGNSFLRAFTLADFGITDAFDVTEVTFGIESLSATTDITVNLYTLQGEFIFANLTLIGSATQELPAQTQTLVTVPVTGSALAGSTLVVEIAAPDLSGQAAFFAGSNDLGETAPSYIAASECGIDEPATYASIKFPDVHLVMTVTGTLFEPVSCALPTWFSIAQLGGTVPAGGEQTVDATLDATGLAVGDYAANLCLSNNDPVMPLAVVPLALTVFTEPRIEVTPTVVAIGEVHVGASSSPVSVTVASTGSEILEVSSITAPANGFALTGGTCAAAPFSLDPDASCTLDYVFSPTSVGNFNSIVTITSNAAPPIGVALTGVGIEPPVDELFRDRFEEKP